MIRLVTRGCFTQNYAKGLVGAPEDREPAVRKLIEGAGGKLLSFYFTTGDTDFMVISEANEAESIIAAMLAAVASGTISDVKTARAWTGAEFKAVAEKLPKQRAIIELPARASRKSGLPWKVDDKSLGVIDAWAYRSLIILDGAATRS